MTKLNNQSKAVIIVIIITVLIWILQEYEVVINRSESLPIHAVIVKRGEMPNAINQIFVFKVKKNHHYKMINMNFIKLVGGFPGNKVTHDNQKVYVDDNFIGVSKYHSIKGLPLTQIPDGIIPEHKIFAYTPHINSFDSRYKDLGLIDEKDIIGTAIFAF